jgi:hypothetical protein
MSTPTIMPIAPQATQATMNFRTTSSSYEKASRGGLPVVTGCAAAAAVIGADLFQSKRDSHRAERAVAVRKIPAESDTVSQAKPYIDG